MKILAIQNFGTSGTTLMHSYVDNHPEILSLPGLFGYEAYNFWLQKYSALNRETIIKTHLYDFDYFFDANSHVQEVHGLNDMGNDHNKNASVDKALYEKYFRELFPENFTRKDFYITMVKSYNLALGREIFQAKYLVFPIHSQKKEVAVALCEDFEEVYFLYMLREPIQNIGSATKHITKCDGWLKVNALDSAISQIYGDIAKHIGNFKVHGIVPYIKAPNAIYGAIKLEDLHNNKLQTLRSLCCWLQINWDDNLLDSTFCGYKWWNRKESARVNGQNTEVLSQKHLDILNEKDKKRILSIGNLIKHYYPYEGDIYNFLSFMPLFEFEKNIEYYKQRTRYVLKRLHFNFEFTRSLWFITWIIDYITIRITIAKAYKFQANNSAELELIY